MDNSEYNVEKYKAYKGKVALAERIKGRLPIIDIAGHPFFVEVRFGTLRPKDNFLSNGINIAEIEPDPETRKLSFYYHIPSMSEFQPSPNLTELPKDVVQVIVPNMFLLDPIGMARAVGLPDRHFYDKDMPLKMYSMAKIIPINKG